MISYITFISYLENTQTQYQIQFKLKKSNFILHYLLKYTQARVLKLVDRHDSGSCVFTDVEVQILSLALYP
jgi:hypothetical protein